MVAADIGLPHSSAVQVIFMSFIYSSRYLRLATAVVLAAVPAVAHHSFAAEYDTGKPVKVTGVVTKVDWQNPHSWIYVDVKSPDGKVASWAFSASPPGVLMRRGVTRGDFKPGTVIKVDGYRAKDGSNNGYGVKVTLADGRSLYVSGDEKGPLSPK
jgi:hypothetical protein